jgi:hypothetical protein
MEIVKEEKIKLSYGIKLLFIMQKIQTKIKFTKLKQLKILLNLKILGQSQ